MLANGHPGGTQKFIELTLTLQETRQSPLAASISNGLKFPRATQNP
jgi:hypothetical protein